MFCDGYCSINDHEIPTKLSNSRIKCTNLGWDPERKCHIVYIPEIDRITQSGSAEWNQRSFSSFGPMSKSIVQKRRELPHVHVAMLCRKLSRRTGQADLGSRAGTQAGQRHLQGILLASCPSCWPVANPLRICLLQLLRLTSTPTLRAHRDLVALG